MYCRERPDKFKLSVVRTVGALCAMRSNGMIGRFRAGEGGLLHRRFGSRAERVLILILHDVRRSVQAGCRANDGLIGSGTIGLCLLLSLARVIVMRAITGGEQPVTCQ